jgi:hypothetical protein
MPKRRHDDRQRSSGWHWLTRGAFLLMLAGVVARLLMSEVIRNPSQPVPGEQATPLGPGPATGLVLDLFATLPALLVLARRSFDAKFQLRHSWAAVAFLLLGTWAVCSTLWSADKFAAIVSSMHWLAAMVLLWSAVQLVNTPLRLRIVAGVCIGVFQVLVFAGYHFRAVEWRDLRTEWETNRTEIVRKHNWTPDSFDAKQFGLRIENGEVMGFSASSNTYGALLVLLGTIAAGVSLQRWRDGDAVGWIAAPIVCIGGAIPCLIWSGSRGAGGTAVLAAILLAVCVPFSQSIRVYSRRIFWLAWGAVLLAAFALVSHGLYHHTLFHDSLTFRWQYWVGSAHMIAAHPLLGVGWENFGPRYLAYRLPIASEEIRDPHNFIVRIVSELGFIGGVLLAIALLRLAWEATQFPATTALIGPNDRDWLSRKELRLANLRILLVATMAIMINIFASLDFGSDLGVILLEMERRMYFWLFLGGGIIASTIRISEKTERHLRSDELEYSSDHRNAPWMLCAILVALAMFLVHNLIDFALFEPGPMMLFALLAGAAIGARRPPESGSAPGRSWAVPLLLLSASAWIAAIAVIVAPISAAESLAQEADEAIRTNQPDIAASKLALAFKTVPYNADYAFRAAVLRVYRHDLRGAYVLLSSAIAANPTSTLSYSWRAQIAVNLPDVGHSQPLEDLSRTIKLDPQSVDFHERYGDMLKQFGDAADARHQYELALQANDGLDPHNPKRLAPADAEALRRLAAGQ